MMTTLSYERFFCEGVIYFLIINKLCSKSLFLFSGFALYIYYSIIM